MGGLKLLHRIVKLIMQIYANLFKINEKCYLSIQKSQQICTWGGDVYYASRNLLSTCFYKDLDSRNVPIFQNVKE